MRCSCALQFADEFVDSLRSDPDLTFLKAYLDGIPRSLTLSTLLEISNRLVVFGPGESWRVHVEREAGRIIARRINLAKRRPSTAQPRSCGTYRKAR
jgi:hypothetical protein